MQKAAVRHSGRRWPRKLLLPIGDGVSKIWGGICERRGLNMGWCGAAHLWSSAQAGSSAAGIAGSPAALSRTPRGVHISSATDRDQDRRIRILISNPCLANVPIK